ncbi:3'-5' exonuclease [Aegicerativicinus sediminis]|uniref:3'-5' exonuclease n=1 Tax=Aegicerativicinus sediminis TaxID=2893202 RepID=UPI001E529028|nr:3'-5' exonuclease [Aegicerativicinus sediminis]
MMNQLNLENILFLDIETVPEHPLYTDLSEEKKQLWEHKSQYQRKEEFTPEDFYEKAGIWAEFGKIICISVGYFKLQGVNRMFRVTSFHGDEKSLLQDFHNLLTSHFAESKYILCAHNGKEFDFPYIARRMLIHGIPLPNKLNLFGKKPWEVPHLDTMELWKFGDYKHFTSLKLLTNVLGIPSPKDDIDGSDVYRVFYIENDIDRIIDYCEKDVIAIAQIVLRLRGENLLEPEEIKQV